MLAPAKTMEQMHRIVFNDYLDAGLCALFMFVVLSIVFYGFRTALQARGITKRTDSETPFEPLPAGTSAAQH
ncbi:Inner membrane protein YjiY [compost metagenome]